MNTTASSRIWKKQPTDADLRRPSLQVVRAGELAGRLLHARAAGHGPGAPSASPATVSVGHAPPPPRPSLRRPSLELASLRRWPPCDAASASRYGRTPALAGRTQVSRRRRLSPAVPKSRSRDDPIAFPFLFRGRIAFLFSVWGPDCFLFSI
jgi:hypothetical protein